MRWSVDCMRRFISLLLPLVQCKYCTILSDCDYMPCNNSYFGCANVVDQMIQGGCISTLYSNSSCQNCCIHSDGFSYIPCGDPCDTSCNVSFFLGSCYCEQCMPGYFCDNGVNATLCPVGTYSSDYGATTCLQCPNATFADTATPTSCKACTEQCLPGTHETLPCNATQDRVCVACKSGTFSLGNASICTVCAPGTYSAAVGQTYCLLCVMGNFCVGGNNLPCFPGTFSSATGQSHCGKCAAGMFSEVTGATSSNPCQLCYSGTYQSNTGSSHCDSCEYTPDVFGTNNGRGATICLLCTSEE